MANQGSLLLIIPPEIRLHIYSFLLDDGNKKWFRIRNKPPFHRSKVFPLPVSSPAAPLPLPPPAAIADKDAAPQKKNQDPRPCSSRSDDKGTSLSSSSTAPPPPRRRTTSAYHVMERTSMFHRRCHPTTYHLASYDNDDGKDDDKADLHVAILAACRLTYHEGAELLYGRHGFDFHDHVEAVVPFLRDRTPYSAALLRTISVYKRGPMPCLGSASEKHEWSYMCRFLASSNTCSSSSSNSTTTALRRLRLVVESGRPSQPWVGIQALTEADIRLMSLVGGYDALEWVTQLAQVQGLETLDVVPDEKYLPAPKSPAMALYAALSVSIGGGLAPFLRAEMNITDGDGLY